MFLWTVGQESAININVVRCCIESVLTLLIADISFSPSLRGWRGSGAVLSVEPV